MKYNPKVNEDMATLTGFAATHPIQPDETVQGNLELLYLEKLLNDVTSIAPHVPARGRRSRRAGRNSSDQGIPRRSRRHEARRSSYLTPLTERAATAAMAGYKVREIKSNENGTVDLESLEAALGDVAGLMLTNRTRSVCTTAASRRLRNDP